MKGKANARPTRPNTNTSTKATSVYIPAVPATSAPVYKLGVVEVRGDAEATMKPGFKTSEFILAVVSVLIPVVNQYFNLHIPTEQVLSIMGVAMTYVFGRSKVKSSV